MPQHIVSATHPAWFLDALPRALGGVPTWLLRALATRQLLNVALKKVVNLQGA
jgi:hypothetical protein